MKITAAVKDLAKGGYVLERDIPKIVEKRGEQWDYTIMQNRMFGNSR